MNRTEWFECSDPGRLIAKARGRVSGRKLRLCSSAAISLVRDWFSIDLCRQALIASEQLAEGRMIGPEVESLRSAIWKYIRDNPSGRPSCAVNADAAAAKGLHPVPDEAARMAFWEAAKAVRPEGCSNQEWEHLRTRAQRQQAELIRCILGNPFHPVTFDPSWCTPTTIGLAEGIYADRAFDRLPILADALEDAGCDHPDVLGHCRGNGPHARGCWVVDLVLGKA